MSSNLQDSAAREAVEAERSIAARKRTESSGSKSKEAIASIDRKGSSSKSETPTSKNSFDFKESNVDSAELALRPSTKSKKSKSTTVDRELETAEWSGDSLDQRIKTVSEEREADEVEIAEPLLDKRGREAVASELFEENESLSAKKPALKGKPIDKIAASRTAKRRPVATSDSGQDEHPWAKNAAAKSQTREASAKTASPKASTSQGLVANDQSQRANASPQLKARRTSQADQSTLDEAQQLEAKARVEALLAQSKSLVNQGEFRSAFRVAQLAQRVADSEDLFFTAGEEQPADIVRSVLMKIRFEESRLASASEIAAETDDSVEVAEKAVSPWATDHTKTVSQSETKQTNLPVGWISTGSQSAPVHEAGKSNLALTPENPWTKGEIATTAQHAMRIKPGSVARSSRINSEFPMRKDEWRSVANEPLTLSGTLESEDQCLTTAPKNFESLEVIQVNQQSDSTEALPAKTVTGETGNQLVPLSLPKKPEGQLQASAQDWRTQDLNDLKTNRSPLLVAPPPPAEEPAIGPVMANLVEDTIAIDVQEQPVPQPESKLWMMLAAAAGAFAMLFVRRRPVIVVRSGGTRQ